MLFLTICHTLSVKGKIWTALGCLATNNGLGETKPPISGYIKAVIMQIPIFFLKNKMEGELFIKQ